MQRIDHFAEAFLDEIVNERDQESRRAAIDRMIHPNVCHVSFDRAVYGKSGLDQRIAVLQASLPPLARPIVQEPPAVRGNTIFFPWCLTGPSGPTRSSGSVFVVFTGTLAEWIYTTADLHRAELSAPET
ncbi:hypothetical protein [Microbacterium oleivorans]|uniref:Nuclear transport factor 2 family protein n=1 Tax=Microbacterium oleivorans TaxID=273677 RepID=A0A7D5EWH7_9MICO|nr:hypothetical protein [Microbacterium oleivorans]QLD10930.1 hypothetical protein HW566_03490 [Microbacterium oleivorans]